MPSTKTKLEPGKFLEAYGAYIKNRRVYLYYRSESEEIKNQIFKIAYSRDGLDFEFYQSSQPASLAVPKVSTDFASELPYRPKLF